MALAKPFSIAVKQEVLDRIAQRIRDYRWDVFPDAGGWRCGTGLADMRKLCDYWLNDYDWRAQEQRLNRFPQFMATIDGIDIHFYHVKGSSSAAGKSRALILTHGWPGSVFEFLNVIEPLAHPEKFGGPDTVGNSADSFDVIVPALPGYGFSGRPANPIGPRAVAAIFNQLMTDVLGYESYIAQGGDWGAGVSSWLAFDHAPACRGLHLNMVMVHSQLAASNSTAEENAWQQRMQDNQKLEGSYAQQQATKPQTLAYALMDSPVGIAAWIIEKFGGWTDVTRAADNTPDLSNFSFDDLLTNIMFYVATDSFATATWLYHGFLIREQSRFFPEGKRCETPTGFAAFPDPLLPPPPRSHVEKSYNLIHYTTMNKGGHFAAMEQPQLFIEDVRAFGRLI
jgi:pimeloyl-ACP methyl ester carboxylesterase